MGISYLLMLIAMTFNVYLFLAVILGTGLGHFLFGWRRSSILDNNEHCH
jgi:copper transporter 1